MQNFVTVRYATVPDNSHLYVNDTWRRVSDGSASPNIGDLVTNTGDLGTIGVFGDDPHDDVTAPGTIFTTFGINSFTTVNAGVAAVDPGGTVPSSTERTTRASTSTRR